MSYYRRRILLLLLGLTGLAFALRVVQLDGQSLWRDEVDAIRFATQPLPALLAMFRKPGENGPLFFLGLRPWLAVAGQSEFALRFPSAWAGTLAVPLLYVLVRRLTAGFRRAVGRGQAPATAALVGALLMATAPYLVWYGQEAKMYALLSALVPLTLLLALDVARRGGAWRWIVLYVLTGLSCYVHLLAVLAIPVQALWLLILPTGPHARARRRQALVYLAALVLPYLPLASWQVGLWLAPPARAGQPVVSLSDIFEVLGVAYSRGIMPVQQPLTLLPAMLALLSGLVLWIEGWPRFLVSRSVAALPVMLRPAPAFSMAAAEGLAPVAAGPGSAYGATSLPVGLSRRRDPAPGRWRVLALLVLWLVLPPLEIYLVSLLVPVFLDRYLIWVMPAFVTLVACGVVALHEAWRPLGLATFGAVLAFNLLGVWMQDSQPIKSDFRAAAAYVMVHQSPGDLLIFQIPYNRYIFSYYAGQGQPWIDGPYTNSGQDQAFVDGWMARGTLGARQAWLIASEVPLWDARGLTVHWLAAHATAEDRADFARVSVTRYVLWYVVKK
jgi:mannosyltransferase